MGKKQNSTLEAVKIQFHLLSVLCMHRFDLTGNQSNKVQNRESTEGYST